MTMTTSEGSSSAVTKLTQACLVSAMPITLVALGGPSVIWSNGGFVVRTVLAIAIFPTVVCGVGALENLARTIISATKIIFEENSFRAIYENKIFCAECRRTTGLVRAALFPVSGWAVIPRLPTREFYVYKVPLKVIKKVTEVAIKVVGHTLEGLEYVGLFKALNCVLKPLGRCISRTTELASKIIQSSLGKAS